jgi:hypothetical protein
MAQSIRYADVNDFGLVVRGADDVTVCGQSGAYDRTNLCKLVDDAIVYYRMQGGDTINALFAKMGSFPPGLPNMPPGRIPEFYRIIAAMRFAQQLGGRALSLRELLFVVETGGEDRGREDDFYRTRTLVKAVLGAPLNAAETQFMLPRQAALIAARAAASNGQPPAPPVTAKPAGGGAAAPLALAAGGFLVGGPVGAGVGLAVGLLASKK